MKTRERKLSKRLQAVAAMVTKGNVVCDVGCDHGFVPVYLVKNGISPKVIAMDINEGPLQAAREHIGKYFLADYIETRLSDGLAALQPGETDTVVCAGMGGRLIVRILEEGKAKLAGVGELILQPQSELQNVRAYLREQGYAIADEDMVLEDGKYYPMMRVCPNGGCGTFAGTEAVDFWVSDAGDARRQETRAEERLRIEDKYGPALLQKAHPVLGEYLQREVGIYGQILVKLQKNGKGQGARIQEITAKLEDARIALAWSMQSGSGFPGGYYSFMEGSVMDSGKSVGCNIIMESLERHSAPSFAEDWDNVGLLAGRRDKEVGKICIALDATDEVIDEAAQKGADMLLSHHPLIFSPVKRITTDDFIGRRIVKLLQNDISYYAMHTNFDVIGMADAAADIIKLKERQVLDITYEDGNSKEGIGRYGKLPQVMTLEECASYVKEAFRLESVKIYGDPRKTIECAAISPGSGKSMIKAAARAGAEVLITGDIEHHEGLDAMAQGLMVIDAGHYGIEKIFVPYMEEYIKREFPGLEVFAAKEKNPFWVMA